MSVWEAGRLILMKYLLSILLFAARPLLQLVWLELSLLEPLHRTPYFNP